MLLQDEEAGDSDGSEEEGASSSENDDEAAAGGESGGESDGYGDEGLSWEAVMASIQVSSAVHWVCVRMCEGQHGCASSARSPCGDAVGCQLGPALVGHGMLSLLLPTLCCCCCCRAGRRRGARLPRLQRQLRRGQARSASGDSGDEGGAAECMYYKKL